MAVYLRTYKNQNTKSQGFGKYYLRTFSHEAPDLEGLVAHIASHNSPFSSGVILGDPLLLE